MKKITNSPSHSLIEVPEGFQEWLTKENPHVSLADVPLKGFDAIYHDIYSFMGVGVISKYSTKVIWLIITNRHKIKSAISPANGDLLKINDYFRIFTRQRLQKIAPHHPELWENKDNLDIMVKVILKYYQVCLNIK